MTYGALISGLKKWWDEGRWVKGSLAYTLVYWGLFRIPHLPVPHRLNPLRFNKMQSESRQESTWHVQVHRLHKRFNLHPKSV